MLARESKYSIARYVPVGTSVYNKGRACTASNMITWYHLFLSSLDYIAVQYCVALVALLLQY
jgi:hypothetical protein